MQISFDFLGFVGRQQANRLLTRTCERRHACDTQTTSIRRLQTAARTGSGLSLP